MHADDARPVLHGRERRDDAGNEPLTDVVATDQAAQRALAGPAGQQRQAQVEQLALARQQGPVVLAALAEADARIEHQAPGLDATRPHRGDALAEEAADLVNDVVVLRVSVLHGTGLHAAHVHQADAACRVGRHHVQRARLTQGLDVVDDVDAQVERRAHDLGLVAVQRDRNAEPDRLAQHRQHTRQLVVERYRIGPGAGGLAADVEQVGALAQQALAVRERAARAGMTSTVGERVRREVDDAHDPGTGQVDLVPGGAPVHRKASPQMRAGPKPRRDSDDPTLRPPRALHRC